MTQRNATHEERLVRDRPWAHFALNTPAGLHVRIAHGQRLLVMRWFMTIKMMDFHSFHRVTRWDKYILVFGDMETVQI